MKGKSYRRINRVISIDSIINDGRASVVDDVNRVADAIARNEVTDRLNLEIKRLKTVIVDGKLQDEVVKGCGKKKLLLVLRMAMRLNEQNNKMEFKHHSKKKKNKKAFEQSPKKDINKDAENEKFNNALRDEWVRKFRTMYGLNGKFDMPEREYNSMLTAAFSLDFSQLMDSTQTHVHFWKAFEACAEKSKQVREQEKRKMKKDQPWRPQGRSFGSQSQITTKDFLLLRIGRK